MGRTSRQQTEPNARFIAAVQALRHLVAERNATNQALERELGEARQNFLVARAHRGYLAGLLRANGIHPLTGERTFLLALNRRTRAEREPQ